METKTKDNFVRFLEHSLETWGSEKNLEIVMSKETIEALVKEIKKGSE